MIPLPRVTPTEDNNYILLDDYAIAGVVVPQFYKTNGANIPRVLWIIVPPFKPVYLPAVIVHDYLCDKEEYQWADALFEEILFSIEKSFKTKMMVWAVKFYHRVRYGVKTDTKEVNHV